MAPKKKLSKEEQEAERLRLEAAAQEAEQGNESTRLSVHVGHGVSSSKTFSLSFV